MTLTLYTFDWLPEFPRGFVRDLRVRWVLEETGQPYTVDTVPAYPKSPGHLALQPFGQVPIVVDGDLTLFESGAILMHLGEGTALLPASDRTKVTQWLFAALNTVEMSVMHWVTMVLATRFPDFFGPPPEDVVIEHARREMEAKLEGLQMALGGEAWLADKFTIADIAMVEVLRVVESEGALARFPQLVSYVDRARERQAFQRAMADHMQHWRAADSRKAATETGR